MRRLAFFTTFSLVLYFTAKTMAADDWTQKSPSTKPSARSQHAMAYIEDDKVILYGGLTASGKNDETWIYDLSANTWTQMNPSPNPGIRCDHAMAYLGGDQVLMFGGSDINYLHTSSCWKYDLSDNTWTDLTIDNFPTSRRYHAMAYIGDGKILMVSGEKSDGYLNDAWLYDTSDPNKWSSKTALTALKFHSMSYIGSDQVLLTGGQNGDGKQTWNYLYDLSDNTWTVKTSLPFPDAESDMVYLGNQQTMLFGGRDWSLNRLANTYIYNLASNTWTTDANSTHPSARTYYRMAETSLDGTSYIVLFGGFTDSRNDDTWTFGGGDYSLPVELTNLTAKSQSGGVLLSWTTESETENLGFVLEKRILDTGIWLLVADYRTDESLQGHGSTSAKHEYQYTDKAVQQGATYLYRLADVDYSGKVKWHKEVEVKVEAEYGKLAEVFRLGAVYPNPLNATLTIPLTLGKTSPVKLALYDINGRLVKIIENGIRPAGEYHIVVDCKDLCSGIYWLKAGSIERSVTKKIILIK